MFKISIHNLVESPLIDSLIELSTSVIVNTELSLPSLFPPMEMWVSRSASFGGLHNLIAMDNMTTPNSFAPNHQSNTLTPRSYFRYIQQLPLVPHFSCQTSHELSIIDPRTIGPEVDPAVKSELNQYC